MKKQKKDILKYYQKWFGVNGVTLIESIIAISLVGVMILIFAASNTYINVNQYLKHKNLASKLVQEELESLRNVPSAKLFNRSNANFIEVAYNKGISRIEPLADAPSLPNVYELSPANWSETGITTLSVVPGFDYSDFTAEAKIKVISDPLSTGQTGLYLRYHDADNYYLVYFTPANPSRLYFVKKVNGTETSLHTPASISFSNTSFYGLKIVASGNNFEIYFDAYSALQPHPTTLIFSATDTDTVNFFSSGRIALFGANSVHAYFDDVTITTASEKIWNFDGPADKVGQTASGWKRFGLFDLPRAVSKLTISDAQTGFSDLKNVKARIEWYEQSKLKFVEISTLISDQSISL